MARYNGGSEPDTETDHSKRLEFECPFDALIWRLVIEKVASKAEIDEHYTLCDILQAVEILDYQADMQKKETEKIKGRSGYGKQ